MSLLNWKKSLTYSDPLKIICDRYAKSPTRREAYVMCLVHSQSVRHFDIALLWKFTNHDDFALTVRYRSLCKATAEDAYKGLWLIETF